MPFNSMIDRAGVEALIPEDVSAEIIQGIPETSAVMRLARRLPNMSSKQRRMPVLSGLISAYWVQGDNGLKQTTQASWANKYVNANELAVIVPIPEAVLDDNDYDVWAEIKPRIVEAFGNKFDEAVMFAVSDAPSDWPSPLITGATSASNVVTANQGTRDLYDDILGEGGLVAKVEEDGFYVNGYVASLSMRSKLRGLRAPIWNGTTLVRSGEPIFKTNMTDATRYQLDGQPIEFPRGGFFNAASALMFAGDWDQLVYSIRQDITYKILTEATIHDSAGNVIVNLAQQDMVALRAVMRLGWQLPNPINQIRSVEADRYPFSVLLP